jgi:outer membrane protein TolC
MFKDSFMTPIIKMLTVVTFFCCPVETQAETGQIHKLSLEDCIHIALEKHQSIGISDANLEIAETQYQQAMSAYWPHISAQSNASMAEKDTTYSFQGQFNLPSSFGSALGPLAGAAAAAQGAGAAGAALATQQLQKALASPIPINTNIKLFDRNLITSQINLTYPLFTGMKREAMVRQAEKGIKMAEQDKRKTTLEIIRDVKKYYFSAQFAVLMEKLADDTLERFKAIEDMTEYLYQHGSMKVKKTDYLRTKTTTAITRTIRSEAVYAREMAHEALGNAMGQEWNADYSLAEPDESSPLTEELKQLIESAQSFNPELQQLKLAVNISQDQITEARSAYYPMIGIQAEAHDVQTDYRGGLTNANNRDNWTIGVGLQWNLFDGFQTTEKVNQAQAQQRKLEHQQILLDQAIALQIKQQFLSIKNATSQIKDSKEASGFSTENRQLNMRAYQEELAETKDVIEAQVVETFALGAYYRSRYAQQMGLLSLEYLIGQNIDTLNR